MSLLIHNGPLLVDDILQKWYKEESNNNYGAFIPFVGTVRGENGIEALSFDIYEPILNDWFNKWQEKAKRDGAILKMAHSVGDVPIHTSSYISAVFSPQRKVALRLIGEFVEDFKASAPIWKYDIIDKKRIYAEDRSTNLKASGILL